MTKREKLEALLWGMLHPFASGAEHLKAATARVRRYHPELFTEAR